ncbi:MAG TPA: MBL fold metallo-hydrolase [Gaiellaceae bacterium]|nr:MBL fold metallo-hydrolase [Gaiellaceae bacterium]
MSAPEIVRVRDTCNVWVIRRGEVGVCIDFGSGAVLDRLDELGLAGISDVLVTHYHRDGIQGLARAAEAGARIWVPPFEQELVTRAGERWSRARVANDYELRQARFSLLESVPSARTVAEYRHEDYGGVELLALPTPGHTMGSVSYLGDLDGRRVAFSGDLVYAAGKVWSLAATQWSYSGVEGQASTILSCGMLARRGPDVLLPAHGEPMENPAAALAETSRRLGALMELRRGQAEPWDLERWLDDPWEPVLPHLLRNRTSVATSYALLSATGAALLIDWGYDLWTGWELGAERAWTRPLLESIGALERNHGIERVEAVVTTHYHDDHVAGIPLLRETHGTEVWAPANVAPVLERPELHDLPCLWFDPIPVDRVLDLGAAVSWNEYELTAHPLPGHTLYAAAIELEVDGRRVLATGDQQGGGSAGVKPDILNYQYRNRFRIDDYVASAALYERLRPELIVSGHWPPRQVTDDYLAELTRDGARLARLHRDLLPLDEIDLGAEGFGARIAPYRSHAASGASVELEVEVLNPFARAESAAVTLALPDGWSSEPPAREVALEPHGTGLARFRVTVGGPVRRVAIAADVTVGDVPFGQQAEALVSVT